MIKEVTMYQCVCDDCGESLREDDKVAWESAASAEYVAEESDWFSYNNMHYCTECQNKATYE